ncbi:MAG: radical SAM protein [Phycisphaerales bacterium]|nr:radical SAM protein [Phycisphaerales bacterium]
MKIGLIAMSGVRACDEELLRLGLTLPGFVERSRTIASLPSLGLLTLAAMTPREHEVAYREVDDVRSLGADLEPFDLVAISTFTAQIEEAYGLADRYRAMGVPVVMGGLHVTTLPDEAAPHCDAVIVGEGEVCWPRVVADAATRRLQPLYRSAPLEFDFADAPIPVFELLNLDRYNRLTVQTSRGCPLRCSFCASSILLTPRYKQKPVEKVLAEIDRIRELWPRPFIEFADDNSFINRAYWKRLLPQLAKRRVRWFTESDIRIGEDDELLDLMRRAGCAEVLIGLESPVEEGLRGLELRTDWKHKRWPRYEQAVRNIQGHGIRVNGCFIVGLDGHTPAVFDSIYRFAECVELFDVQVTLPTPFPGTALYQQLQREGRLFEEKPWRKCTLFDLTFEPRPMSASELRSGFHHLATRLYSDEFTHQRRAGFRRQYRQAARLRSRRAS